MKSFVRVHMYYVNKGDINMKNAFKFLSVCFIASSVMVIPTMAHDNYKVLDRPLETELRMEVAEFELLSIEEALNKGFTIVSFSDIQALLDGETNSVSSRWVDETISLANNRWTVIASTGGGVLNPSLPLLIVNDSVNRNNLAAQVINRDNSLSMGGHSSIPPGMGIVVNVTHGNMNIEVRNADSGTASFRVRAGWNF